MAGIPPGGMPGPARRDARHRPALAPVPAASVVPGTGTGTGAGTRRHDDPGRDESAPRPRVTADPAGTAAHDEGP
ncbi:hypothetical protein GCM10017559_05580 [Streptosporangium longisporum]|uniref:Uncharacterized protein n=1 Tax=Streptosporangium longisporum TaxID=46187 RepID=A0ABN3XS07_9ACTN